MADGRAEAACEGTPEPTAALRFARIFMLVAVATVSGLVAITMLRLGLDPLVDRMINGLIGGLVPDGRLRLAGVSAPLSEEPARLVGFLVSIGGFGWMARRMGVPISRFELRGRRPPSMWVFGMVSGAAFAVQETLWNGEPLIAILSRTLSHGSFGVIIAMALVLRRTSANSWPVLGGLLLAMLLHAVGNIMGALGLAEVGFMFRVLVAYLVGVGAWMAVLVRPDLFEHWTYDLRRRTRAG